MMLQLKNVTLLGIDCIDIDRLIFASEVSQKYIEFGEVKLLTHLPSEYPNIVPIPPIKSLEAYSEFMIKRLNDYVATDYVLVIQHDGFVVNPNAWTDEFLEYDYIGAIGHWGMGNGGFSLRSKKLLQILASADEISKYHPEDVMICKTYRNFLIEKGINFATHDIANLFSKEMGIWKHQFGFHNADLQFWNIEDYTESPKHDTYVKDFRGKYGNNPIKLTYVVQFYIENETENPLLDLINIYNRYDKDIMQYIHFVFVDDHSRTKITIPSDIQLNYTLLRIKDDIMWNQGGARNLGVEYAKSDKLILTDLDIIFPENLLESLLYFGLPGDAVFKFTTVSGMRTIQSHFNVFFTSKQTFYKTNGIDEEFCGNYGHEDTFFYYQQKAMGTKFYRYTYSNIVHREHKNSETHQHNKLIRDLEVNSKLNEKKIALMRNSDNPLDARSDLHLNFNWEVVEIRSMA